MRYKIVKAVYMTQYYEINQKLKKVSVLYYSIDIVLDEMMSLTKVYQLKYKTYFILPTIRLFDDMISMKKVHQPN